MENNLIPLLGSIQRYAWGIRGESSLAGRMWGGTLEPETPYAELWFGAHPSAPSHDRRDGKSVIDLIVTDPARILGDRVVNNFGATVPFLVKILSVAKPLSIQSHPTLEQAKILHARNPKEYPDTNHKPEMSVAITPVELLYGFRPIEELRRNAREIRELRDLVGESVTEEFLGAPAAEIANALRTYFTALMKAPSANVQRCSAQLVRRLREESVSDTERWVVRAASEYPDGDVGLFCFFLLNLLRIQPGKALFIGSNIPHAYLSGEMLEVMANSDNVMRAGLTGKFRDAEALAEMLNYEPVKDPKNLLLPSTQASGRELFDRVAGEFRLELLSGDGTQPVDSVELLFVLAGTAVVSVGSETVSLESGSACLVAARSESFTVSQAKALTMARIRVP